MKRFVRFCYRKIIDASSDNIWDKLVWESTYEEYRLQSQNYASSNSQLSYSSLVQKFPAAEKLPFLVSAAAVGYIKQLNNVVPDVKSKLGKLFLPFNEFNFEIIESSFDFPQLHRIAISFYSYEMQILDAFGSELLLASFPPDFKESGVYVTEMLDISKPLLSIYSIKYDYE